VNILRGQLLGAVLVFAFFVEAVIMLVKDFSEKFTSCKGGLKLVCMWENLKIIRVKLSNSLKL
jgi:hypothetical protein